MLKNVLMQDEGFIATPYQDTKGIWTGGFGHNLSNPIDKDIWELVLDRDIRKCKLQLADYDWYCKLDDVRQDAIVMMCFNLGLGGLLKFKQTIEALSKHDYIKAAEVMLKNTAGNDKSQWYKDVGERAFRISEMIRTGQY